MKLHLGCGRHVLEEYINIDAQDPRAQIKWDRLDNIPGIDPGSADEILIVHVFEHLWPDEVLSHIEYWHGILRPGGVLILEMPDLYKSAKNFIDRVDRGDYGDIDRMALWAFYGDNPRKSVYDCHKWGWTFETLKPKLIQGGFREPLEKAPQWHGARVNRDFRVEATKQ